MPSGEIQCLYLKSLSKVIPRLFLFELISRLTAVQIFRILTRAAWRGPKIIFHPEGRRIKSFGHEINVIQNPEARCLDIISVVFTWKHSKKRTFEVDHSLLRGNLPPFFRKLAMHISTVCPKCIT